MALRRALCLLLLLLASSAMFAQAFVFDLRGSQEVPPVPTTAIGGCFAQLDQGAATLAFTCVHDVAGPTVMHVHRGPAGANGAVAFDLGDPASPVTATWTGMTATDINDALTGNLYVNIHTAGRPAGEIRGQIVPSIDTVAFSLSGAQVVPPSGSASTGSCTADLNAGATSLAVACTHNVTAPDAAHIHDAPAGTTGPIVFTFPSAASPLNAAVPMTPLLVAKYAATFLALDVHRASIDEANPGDEIRGQMGAPPAPASTGTIVIAKSTHPAGGTGFGFTETITNGSFTLDDGGTRTFSSVPAGTYTVTEDDPSALGFAVAGISCDDADSTTNPFSRAATIQVSGGETVQCTFDNVETSPTSTIFVFDLSGAQEVPPTGSSATGGCFGQFDAGASELTLVCTHNVIGPTIAHLHRGAPGVNGPIVFDLGNPTSPIVATWTGMTPADVADLLAGNIYINLHTSGRPAGEIRGQVLPRTVDTIAFPADGSQEVPPTDSPATGNCTADLNNSATALAVQCTHNVASPTAAHLHDAPRGSDGPVVFDFPGAASPISSNVAMTPRLVADFAAGFLYVNIHSSDYTEGAIRGQVAPSLAPPTTGTIIIAKSTDPAGGAGFTFTDDIQAPNAFTLADGGTKVFTSIPAGTYTVTENDPTPLGYSLAGVSCGDADSTGDPFQRAATIRLAAGETVTCTFQNLQSVPSPTQFVFHLSGAQEVPASGSTARGGCYGQFDSGASQLTLVCTHNVDGPTIAHIHRGAAGTNGPAVFDLGNPASPILATWSGMAPADVADLLAGNLYLNIHASGRPEGEIRGQILPRTVDAISFPMSGSQEVPPTDSPSVGNCTADLATNADSVFVSCSHNVPFPLSAHLHDAPPGIDGPVIFDFPTAGSFSATLPLTPREVADFAAGFLYVNIHSDAYPEGAIRGQFIAGPAAAVAAAIPTVSEWAALLMVAMLAALAWWRMR